jgi:activating signal cointegrator complex subunit 3
MHNAKKFLQMPEHEISAIAETLRDKALKDTILFGIGMHHAGLDDHDRSTVENLFCNGSIQVLVCTSTLAWGVNFPAHLVIVKGTEFFDPKQSRYVDYPITDVLQMMGRAGRPQFDDTGVACIFAHEPKKNFYKKFLHEPFPVESSLRAQLHNHFNAELAMGTLKTIRDLVDYMTWTYFFRRLIMNPSYYHLEDTSPQGVEDYLLGLVEATVKDLEAAGCVAIQDDNDLICTTLGHIASYYYVDYRTVGLFHSTLAAQPDLDVPRVVKLLADAQEFAELPVVSLHNSE